MAFIGFSSLTVRLMGGLGNQMFQYAAGLALAEKESAALELDARGYGADPLRSYALGRLRVAAPLGSFPGLLPFRLALRSPAARALLRPLGWSLLMEQGFAWQPLSLKARHTWMSGFWQSWRYGASVAGELRAAFRPAAPARGRNAALLRALAAKPAVCVHVRRGDYARDPQVAAVHGALPPAYYRAGLKRLGAAAARAGIYVFSDEPDWARRNLGLKGKVRYVGHNSAAEPEEDLRLMAACSHFVIANSSLSWWAAWLGSHPSKRVIAPRRWFAGAGHDTKDLCPPAWTRQ